MTSQFLWVDPKKCNGCMECETACALVKTGEKDPVRSRIRVIDWNQKGLFLPVSCQHCETAPCLAVCPKEAIHRELLGGLMDIWLAPLKALNDAGDPVAELLDYVERKLEMSRDMPRESRLFAGEVLQGAPRFGEFVAGPLKALVDEKAALIQGWVDAGRIAPVDPYHLIFSIWASTQHYADFDTQVRAILTPTGDEHLEDACAFLCRMYAGLLRPNGSD